MDSKFKCHTCGNQHTDIAGDCPAIELNGQSLEIVGNFCYLGSTIGATVGAVDSVITRIKSGWCKFRDFVPLLASMDLPLGAKSRSYSACVRCVMLYES